VYVAWALTTLFLRSSGNFSTDPACRTGVLVRRLQEKLVAAQVWAMVSVRRSLACLGSRKSISKRSGRPSTTPSARSADVRSRRIRFAGLTFSGSGVPSVGDVSSLPIGNQPRKDSSQPNPLMGIRMACSCSKIFYRRNSMLGCRRLAQYGMRVCKQPVNY
jgi:hypothetical protein